MKLKFYARTASIALTAFGFASVCCAAPSTLLIVINNQFTTGLTGYAVGDGANGVGTFTDISQTVAGPPANNPEAETGNNVAYLNSGGMISQNLSANGANPGLTFVAGETYTFTVYFGADAGKIADKAQFGFYNPNAAGTGDLSATTFQQTANAFSKETDSYTATAADAGDPIGIYIKNMGSGIGGDDSVHAADLSVSYTGAKYSNNLPGTSSAPRLNLSVAAVDPDIFHIIAYPKDNPAPPASPFVVERQPWAGAITPKQTTLTKTVQIPAGTLTLQASGNLRLQNSQKQALLPLGTVTETSTGIILTLHHAPAERLYGAGNAGMNQAGDLTHPYGTTLVSNGVTRVPFLWSTGGWGILIANDQTGISWQDNHGTLTWTVPGPFVDMYLIVAPTPYKMLNAYSRLTGRAPIPPRWTFGFLMSRWGYANAAAVQSKWDKFRDLHIPVDAFIYDYDWFVNDWHFNPVTFPPGSLAKMRSLGLHFVGIRKPRVNGAHLDYARSQGWVLKSPFGYDLRFDLPAARYWWWSHQVPLVQAGVDGWWNDEAEQTNDEFFQMARTEWNGWRAMSDRRAWSLNRAFSPGMARFGAAVWSGDTDSSWAALQNQPGTMLNWEMAGMPYDSQDIGGFQSLPTPELYARWNEEGVFVPIMRDHGTYNSPRWPWAFGPDVLTAVREAIDLRYRLIPYLYTLAENNNKTGAPLMRPLFFEFPNDPKTYNLEDEWLVGNGLLAAPVLAPGGARNIYLPAGEWYDFNTGAAVRGGQTLHVQAPLNVIPAYVRAGTILPLGPVFQSTSLGKEDPLEIRIYPGANAKFTLYEDNGRTYVYQRGESSEIPMHWNNRMRTFTVGTRRGMFPGMLTTRHFVVALPNGQRKSVIYKGHAESVRF